jgi:hypothetical protein
MRLCRCSINDKYQHGTAKGVFELVGGTEGIKPIDKTGTQASKFS